MVYLFRVKIMRAFLRISATEVVGVVIKQQENKRLQTGSQAQFYHKLTFSKLVVCLAVP